MTQILTENGLVRTTSFTAYRIIQCPFFSGTKGPSGATGVMAPMEMAAHIWKFRPKWRKVAEVQEFPVEIRVEGKFQGKWHTATMLAAMTLNPISQVWPSLGDLGLDMEAAIVAAMDREEAEGRHMTRRTVPVGMIETVTAKYGGIEIDCGSAGQFRLGRDGYIY
jgi:hypothetical protein